VASILGRHLLRLGRHPFILQRVAFDFMNGDVYLDSLFHNHGHVSSLLPGRSLNGCYPSPEASIKEIHSVAKRTAETFRVLETETFALLNLL